MAINLSQMGNKKKYWKANIHFMQFQLHKNIFPQVLPNFLIFCTLWYFFLLSLIVLWALFLGKEINIFNSKHLNYMKHLFVIKTLLGKVFLCSLLLQITGQKSSNSESMETQKS